MLNYICTSSLLTHHKIIWKYPLKVDRMKKEMAYHEIPQDVQIRVMKFYDYLWLNQKHHDASSLHHDENLSGALRKEIAVYLYRDVLEVGPLFNKCPPHCLARVAMTL